LESTYGPAVDGNDPTEGFMVELDGRAVGFAQRYLLDDYPEWSKAVGVERAAGIDYLIGVAELIGVGLGPVILEGFTASTFERYEQIDCVAVAVQQANRRSWRALEKAGFEQVLAGEIDSDDPSDAGASYTYVRRRPPPA
jgi:aminoglycoside 6'-N-acetyltransferase